jgi:hypothetical protein
MATATSIQFWNVIPRSVIRCVSQMPTSAAYRLDTGVDLDAPPRHLAIAAVGGVHAGITPGCIRPSCTRPVAGIWDQMEALGLEEGFSIGEEERNCERSCVQAKLQFGPKSGLEARDHGHVDGVGLGDLRQSLAGNPVYAAPLLASRAMVERLQPVAACIAFQELPASSMATMPALRSVSSMRPLYRPSVFAFAIPCACRRRRSS